MANFYRQGFLFSFCYRTDESEWQHIYNLPAFYDKDIQEDQEVSGFLFRRVIYTEDKKNSANIVYYEEKLDEKTRVIVYKDEDENNSKRKRITSVFLALERTGIRWRTMKNILRGGVYISCRRQLRIPLLTYSVITKAAGPRNLQQLPEKWCRFQQS